MIVAQKRNSFEREACFSKQDIKNQAAQVQTEYQLGYLFIYEHWARV